MTYYVLFFIHLESRRVSLAGITRHPDQAWMQQMARNATGEAWGFLPSVHDHDLDLGWRLYSQQRVDCLSPTKCH